MVHYEETTPTNVKETNDCVVRSLSIALKITYLKAHEFCAQFLDRKSKDGVTGFPFRIRDKKTEKELERMGFNLIPHDTGYVRRYDGRTLPMNVRRFCRTYPRGTFIILGRGHAWCIIDGQVHDWGNNKPKLQRKCIFAFRVQDNRQLKLF